MSWVRIWLLIRGLGIGRMLGRMGRVFLATRFPRRWMWLRGVAVIAIGVRGWTLLLLVMRRYLMRLLLRRWGLLLLMRSSFALPLFPFLPTVARIRVVQNRSQVHRGATSRAARCSMLGGSVQQRAYSGRNGCSANNIQAGVRVSNNRI